ncbi:MAG: hypothetical protein [Caudoviricetes sp.]|nr:MAG: hypothetical protein [Caudoviricetes sp.]
MTQQSVVKTYIKGFVAENGIEGAFNRHLEELEVKYKGVQAVSDEEAAAFILALAYFGADKQ